MTLDIQKIDWADSMMESVLVQYDTITIQIKHDDYSEPLLLACTQCAGMTQLVTWDEAILESITIEQVDKAHCGVLVQAEQAYQGDLSYLEKSFADVFWQIRIDLIDHTWFDIICKEYRLLCHKDQEAISNA